MVSNEYNQSPMNTNNQANGNVEEGAHQHGDFAYQQTPVCQDFSTRWSPKQAQKIRGFSNNQHLVHRNASGSPNQSKVQNGLASQIVSIDRGHLRKGSLIQPSDAKQLPPLNPKSIQQNANKKQSLQKRQSLIVEARDPGLAGEDLYPKRKLIKQNDNQVHQNTFSNACLSANSNFSSVVVGQDNIQKELDPQPQSLDRRSVSNNYLRQPSAKEALSIIIRDQQLSIRNKQSSTCSKSPYNVNQTAELLVAQEKNGPLNSRQKRLKQVLFDYQGPFNQNLQLQELTKSSPMLNKIAQPISSPNSPQLHMHKQLTLNMNTMSPKSYKYGLDKERGLKKQFSHTIIRPQHNPCPPKQDQPFQTEPQTYQSIKQSNDESLKRPKDKLVERKPTDLKLNLANINNNLSSNNTSQTEAILSCESIHKRQIGALTAKNKNELSKNLQLNLKSIPEHQRSNRKLSQQSQNSVHRNLQTAIKTDNSRFHRVKQSSLHKFKQFQNGNTQSSPSLAFNFASSRGRGKAFPPSKQGSLKSLEQDQSNKSVKTQRNQEASVDRSDGNDNIMQKSSKSNEEETQRCYHIKEDQLQQLLNQVEGVSLSAKELPLYNRVMTDLVQICKEHQQNKLGALLQNIQQYYEEVGKQSTLLPPHGSLPPRLNHQNRFHLSDSKTYSPSSFQGASAKNKSLQGEVISFKGQIEQLKIYQEQQQHQLNRAKQEVCESQHREDVMRQEIKQHELRQGKEKQDFTNISKQMNSLYEANQQYLKENKRLRADLKQSQCRERDCMSVLKNTSEFSKLALTNIDQGRTTQKDSSSDALAKDSQICSSVASIPEVEIREPRGDSDYFQMKKELEFDDKNNNTNQNLNLSKDHIPRVERCQQSAEEDEDRFSNNGGQLSSASCKDQSSYQQPTSQRGYHKCESSEPVERQKPRVPTLNFLIKTSQHKAPVNKLDFKSTNKIREFQDEFMDKYEEYSKSWRDAIKRERRF